MLKLRLSGWTYRDIAGKAGISQQRVQQILSPPPGIRNQVIEAAGGICQTCGIWVGQSGHVHHIEAAEFETYNHIPSLRLLCPSCHRKAHGGGKVEKPPRKHRIRRKLATEKYIIDDGKGNREITELKCERCNHTWWPRTPMPKQCPACQSRTWDIPSGKAQS
ncbi:MAG: hypothetical protein DDT33_01345 [Firmicutes bacterium]|nr:hypothetical protein [Bacillota bacterium]